ncbi:MAG: hypothetical protein JXJ22_12005 [Bacteroidales bacterium]|nr:hypothetical protein [Bacteroidales bacterium]
MEIEPIESGNYDHMYNRGINRENIFSADEHYIKFLDLCKKYLPRMAEVFAYCLLPSHFHFVAFIKADTGYLVGV